MPFPLPVVAVEQGSLAQNETGEHVVKTGILAIAVAMTLVGCVTSSGIQPDGADAYRIMSAGKTGFSSSASMKSDLYEKAAAFCGSKGQVVETIEQTSQQARPLGGFPEATLRFRCVTRSAGG